LHLGKGGTAKSPFSPRHAKIAESEDPDFLPIPSKVIIQVRDSPSIMLPTGWPGNVKSAVLHAISLAHFIFAYTRGWAANSINERVRLKAELKRARTDNARLREEIRIHRARMEQIAPHRRPFYPPVERMAVLEVKTVQHWSLAQTATAFLVADATIASWMKRLDEHGPNALVQLREPVNKFPDFVRCIVRRLKVLCPTLGKVKVAEVLARAGLHLGATTIGRMLKEMPRPEPGNDVPAAPGKKRVVTAKYPNHVWHTDLTVVPTMSGFWTSWLPNSLAQRWPFCYWIAVAEDHYSRRIMGAATFFKQPTAIEVRTFLGRTIQRNGAKPKHLVSDKGAQFWNQGYKQWCRQKSIKPRFGAVGKQGSIAVTEQLILTLKTLLAGLLLVPFLRRKFQRELDLTVAWYNEHRPHTTLGGKTPNEVHHDTPPANRGPRFEVRAAWPRGSPCAAPITLVKGQPGVVLKLHVDYLEGRKHLPLIKLRRTV
jgi:transposase InsO family protein